MNKNPIKMLLDSWKLAMWRLEVAENARKKWTPIGSKYTQPVRPKFAHGAHYDGPVAHWREFENHLVNLHKDGFDWKKFVGGIDYAISDGQEGGDEVGEIKTAQLQFLDPAQIAAWSLWRRTYRLSEELQVKLAATPLDTVDWSMISFPFPSFLIELPIPIPFDGRGEIGSILVSSESEFPRADYWHHDGFRPKTVCYIPTKLASIESTLTIADRKRILRMVDNNPGQVIRELTKSSLWKGSLGSIIKPIHPEILTNGGVADFETIKQHEDRMLVRILFGLMLYLQSSRGMSVSNTSWLELAEEDPQSAADISFLSDPGKVVSLGDEYALRPELREYLRDSMLGKDTSQHAIKACAVRGYWRRPPGGIVAGKPKTVEVDPYIMGHKTLQEQGGLVEGSTHFVS